MSEFLDLALSLPNLVFTALLLCVMAYWLFVILGALDIEMLDMDMDSDLDLDVDVDMDVDADIDGDVDGDLDGESFSLGNLLRGVGLGGVPVTIVISAVVLFSWTLSMLITGPFWVSMVGGVMSSLAATGIGIAAFVLAIPMASGATRPFRGVFITHQAPRRRSLIGSICRITTSRVDDEFGQAEIEDGGAGFLVQVRCQRNNQLTRGSEAVVFEFDEENEVFLVAPTDGALIPDDSN